MRVFVHPADEGACGAYRMEWPARALKAQGHDVHVKRDWSYQALWRSSVFGDRVVGLAETIKADVVVLQRPLQRNRVELISAMQDQGVAVVVEIDDDFHEIHPRNPAWRGSNPLREPDRNRDWLLKACDRADLVTVTTPALAERYGRHGRVAVLPNYVPESYLSTKPGAYTEMFMARPSGLLLGWSGSVATHPDDLQVTGDTCQSVLDATGARFHVIGTGVKVAEKLGLAKEPTATGWVPIEAYPEAMAQLDVGIVPLAPTRFNEAKSWLKGLEYASVGVPFVASATGPYRELARLGIGWTAETPGGWERNVTALLTDHVLREEMGSRWQDMVAESFTIEANAFKWLESWARAAQHRVAA